DGPIATALRGGPQACGTLVHQGRRSIRKDGARERRSLPPLRERELILIKQHLSRFTSLIQSLPISLDPDGEHDGRKECDGPELSSEVREADAFQHHAPCDAVEVGNGQYFANHLRPHWHSPEWKHEAGKQDGG